MARPYIKDLYWMPKSWVSMNDVKKNFTITLYDDGEEEVILEAYKFKKMGGTTLIGLPRGRVNLIKQCMIDPKQLRRFVDKRTVAPVKFDLKMLGEYQEHQPSAITALAKSDNGILKSMARTGKCVDINSLIVTDKGLIRIGELLVADTWKTQDMEDHERGFSLAESLSVPGEISKDNLQLVKFGYSHAHSDTLRVVTESGFELIATPDEKFRHNHNWVELKDLEVGNNLYMYGSILWRQDDYAPTGGLPTEYINRHGRYVQSWLATLCGYMVYSKVLSEDEAYVELDFSSVLGSSKLGCQHIDNLIEVTLRHASDDCYKIANYQWRVPRWIVNTVNSLYLGRSDTRRTKEIPHHILRSRAYLVKVWLRAVYEARGICMSPTMDWHLPTPELAREIQVVALNLGIKLKRPGAGSWLTAHETYTARWIDRIRMYRREGHPSYALRNDDISMTTERIVSIDPAGVRPVFDIEVEETHAYYANGFYVHNTVMGVGAIVERGQKTLVLAHQTDLLEQLHNETIHNKEGILFNGQELANSGKPVSAMCSTYEDFKTYDICLTTYQSFLSPSGQRLLKRIKDLFGIVLIDEVHRTPAERYSQVISQFSARCMWGLTATNDRKDGKFPLADLMVGPVIHQTKAKSLALRVYGIETKVKHKKPPTTWNGITNFLFRDEHRNEKIAKTAVRDVKRGHVVLIPVMRHEHAGILKKKIDYYYGKEITFLFTGAIPKNKRQDARDRMNNDSKIRVVIAMRSMLTGVNIPRWSAIYTVAPISNQPNYEQEVFRVCTPMEGKRKPILRYFFDGLFGLSHGCLRTCMKTLSDPKFGFEIHPSLFRVSGKQVQRSDMGTEGEKLTVSSMFTRAAKPVKRF